MREAYGADPEPEVAKPGKFPDPVADDRPEEIKPFLTEESVRIQTAPAEPVVPVVPANGVPAREIYHEEEDVPTGTTGTSGNSNLDSSADTVRDFLAGNYSPPVTHWQKQKEHFKLPQESIIPLPRGAPKKQPKIQHTFGPETAEAKAIREKRRAKVKAEMEHAWKGYRLKAWMHDEVMPVTGGFKDPFCGWAATMVDGLDTLWIMGMKEEFEEAVQAVAKIDFSHTERSQIPVFETTIRYLGGLQGAYDVSGGKYKVLLDKAVELAEILMGIFDTPNRMPVLYYSWDPKSASEPKRASSRANFAELASLSLEFTRLAQLTGDARYYDAVARITNELVNWQKRGTKMKGVFPDTVDAQGCNTTAGAVAAIPEAPNSNVYHDDGTSTDPVDDEKVLVEGRASKNQTIGKRSPPARSPARVQRSNNRPIGEDCPVPQGLTGPSYGRQYFSMGGGQDSSYEYFTKMYLLTGGLDESYKHLYLDTMDAVRKYMLFRPMIPNANRSILFSAKVGTYGQPEQPGDIQSEYEVTHLTCFLGGMVGMGAKIFGIQGDHGIAERLTDGCVWAYEATQTGIMAELAHAIPCENVVNCPWDESLWYRYLDPQYNSRDRLMTQYLERKAEKAKKAAAAEAATAAKAKVAADSPNGAAAAGAKFDFDDEITEQIAKQQVKPAQEVPGEANHVHARDDAGIKKRSPPKYRDDERYYKRPTASKTVPDAVVEAAVELDGQVGGPPPLPKLAADEEGDEEYDPDRPQTHKEYVEERIKRERIPKGFAGMTSKGYILR